MSASTSATWVVALVAGRGLEVEAQQRLGVRRPQVEPPLAEVDGEAVEAVLLDTRRTGAATRSITARGSAHLGVDLAGVGVALERLAQLRQRLPRTRQLLEHDMAAMIPESAR